MRLPTLTRAITVVLGMPFLFACEAPSIPHVSYSGTHLDTSHAPDILYAAAVRTTVRRGWGLQSRDPVGRVVETDWITLRTPYYGFDGRRNGVDATYRIFVTDGRLEVYSDCRIIIPGDLPPTHSCPTGARPEAVIQLEQELVKAILTEADVVDEGPPAAATSTPGRGLRDDVVYLKNGGRLRGTVVEDDPKKGITLRLLDGKIRFVERSAIDHVGYSPTTPK